MYILDDNDCPRLVEHEEFFKWAHSLPNTTGMGFTLDYTEIGGVTVSTVYLGMDHGFSDGPPVLWETVVFDDEGRMERYTSRRDAQDGHNRICGEILNA